MNRPFFPAMLALVSCLALAPYATAEDDGPEAKLIAAKAPLIVSVNFVLEFTAERDGRVQEGERRARSLGVVVDASGLIMLPAQALEVTVRRPGRARGRRSAGGSAPTVRTKPTNIRVTFPGDEKEYAAILGAKDSKTGLAFVLIDDLGSAKPQALDASRSAAPRVGQALFGVSRLGQSYDHAPVCVRTRVTGKIDKPRTMWAIANATQHVGKPLFDASGAVAGICTLQSSGEQASGLRAFLLPVDAVKKVIDRAGVQAAKALAEVREARAEEEAAEAEDAKPTPVPADKPDGDKKDADKKDG